MLEIQRRVADLVLPRPAAAVLRGAVLRAAEVFLAGAPVLLAVLLPILLAVLMMTLTPVLLPDEPAGGLRRAAGLAWVVGLAAARGVGSVAGLAGGLAGGLAADFDAA